MSAENEREHPMGSWAAMAIALVLTSVPSIVRAQDMDAGFVVEAKGGWRVDGTSQDLAVGKVVRFRDVIRPVVSNEAKRIVIALYARAMPLAQDCEARKACAPLLIGEPKQGDSIGERVQRAASRFFKSHDDAEVVSMAALASRDAGDSAPIQMTVMTQRNGELRANPTLTTAAHPQVRTFCLRPVSANGRLGRGDAQVQLRVLTAAGAGQGGFAPLPMGCQRVTHGDRREELSADRPIPPGLYQVSALVGGHTDCAVFDCREEGTPAADTWVVVAADGGRDVQGEFFEALRFVSTWPKDEREVLLRAFLADLAFDK